MFLINAVLIQIGVFEKKNENEILMACDQYRTVPGFLMGLRSVPYRTRISNGPD